MLSAIGFFLILLFLGMPVAFAIAVSGFAFFVMRPEIPWTILVQKSLSTTQSFTMLAIPLFIFAGNLMNNTGITLVDVRKEAMDAIRKLKSGDIDVKTAGAIKDLLNTVVDTAKTQVAYIQSIPNTIKDQMSVNEVKAIAGTLVDRDAELDCSLAEIRQNQKQIYK